MPIGCVETGVIKLGMIVTFGPIAVLTTEVKIVEMHHEPLLEALSGDNVGFNLKNIVNPGFVASNSKDALAKEAANFTSRIIMVYHPGQIGNGYAPVLAHIAIKSAEICLKIGRPSGKELEKNGDVRMVKIIPTKPMVVDTFTSYPPLDRFSVRDMRWAVYVGVIKSMEKKDLTGAKVTKA